MGNDFLMNIVQWLLPGGAVGSVVTWFATRKIRRMDVLKKLQQSIDLLTNKYTEVLNENVQLKADNAKLLANQRAMEEKIDALNNKIDILTKQLKSKRNETINQGNNPSSGRRSPVRGVRAGKQIGDTPHIGSEPGKRAAGTVRQVGPLDSGQPVLHLQESPGGNDRAKGDLLGDGSGLGRQPDHSCRESH